MGVDGEPGAGQRDLVDADQPVVVERHANIPPSHRCPPVCASQAAARSGRSGRDRHAQSAARTRRAAPPACPAGAAAPVARSPASRPAAASCAVVAVPATVSFCTTWFGGPTRKSICAPTVAGMPARVAGPPIFSPSPVTSKSSVPWSRSRPATIRPRCRPVSWPWAWIGIWSIVTSFSSGTERVRCPAIWPAGVGEVDRVLGEQVQARLAQHRQRVRHRSGQRHVDGADLVRGAEPGDAHRALLHGNLGAGLAAAGRGDQELVR